jgi:hypothetical protein
MSRKSEPSADILNVKNMENGKQKGSQRRGRLLYLPTLMLAVLLQGCSVIDFARFESSPTNSEIISGYWRTGVKLSSPADVLDEMFMPEYETISQTKRVIATAGQKKSGNETWTKIAAFDENESTARRKYVFIADEKPRTLFAAPRANAYFEYQAVIDKNILDTPYASESARLIAILKNMREKAKTDIAEVAGDNNVVRVCSGMFTQSFASALAKLKTSPSETSKLNSNGGVSFSHPSFDEGRIQLGIEYEIATVRIKIGSSAKKWRLSRDKDLEKEAFDPW